MAVLLVLASGTAVSLAVTDGEDSAVGSNAAAQETTEVGEETTDVGNEETTEVGDEVTTEADDESDATEDPASVTINDQESDGERIVVEEVTMEEGGFIAIHDETLVSEQDAIGSVVGTSVYLEAGTHENVIITLGRPISETQTLIAMPHQDTNENEVYDFVISGGEADGPYATADDIVVDDATVTVGEDEGDDVETTTEDVDDVETTTEDTDVIETTTEIDDVVETTTEDEDVVETTEEDDVETTTEEEGVIETTTEEDEVVETTTEEVDDVETTTEEEVVETTTEEEDEVETTTEVDDVEEPAEDEQQLIFKVEQMNIDRWSFVLGDEEEPDRTETVSDITVQDRRVEINLTEVLQEQSEMPSDQMTTQDPEEVQEQLEENLSGDIETVRFVIENVNVENVTFVITAPEDMELPETPDDVGPETTTEEDEVIETTTEEVDDVETTTEEEVVETTTEEEDDVETTTEDEVETTEVDDVETTEEDDEVIETTTEEVDDVETTTEEEVVETTTTEEEVVETTTEEDEVETTTEEEAELESFNVSALNAPESAEVGDTINVSAVVTNPNDVEATQEVAFRLEGTVVAREDVTLNASGSTTVEFQVDTTDVPPGEYIHGIYTRDFGELAVVTLEDPTAEETDDAVETETEEDEEETELPDDEETELPDDDEETTVAIETTTEA